MLWLALHLPWLALEALSTGEPQVAGRCVVEQRRVLVADRAARSAGVEPGMSTATATSLAPEVQQWPRNAAREAAFVQLLALALSRYTPTLVVQDDGVMLEAQASLRLFGGLRPLLRQVRLTARGCGAHARLGMAPTAGAAALFARVPSPSGRPARAVSLPRTHRLLDALRLSSALAVLRQEQRLIELMQSLGCRCVGDVRALPRKGLHRRGAAELLNLLDRAYGDTPDPQRWFEPPLQFRAALELGHRADDAMQLLFAAERMVQPLAGWLSSRWLAARRLHLTLKHERNRQGAVDTELPLELGLPSRDAAQIMALLRERLQRLELAAPVYAVELHLDAAEPLAGQAGELLPHPGQQAQEFKALLDRLSARLGPERVQRLVLRSDHRPELASAALPALHAPETAAPAAPVATPRPVWLLPEPLPLAEQDGLPVHGSKLMLLTRTERIEAGWFDGAIACRDYHLAVGEDHRLRWIFRARCGGEMAWYLHGLFA